MAYFKSLSQVDLISLILSTKNSLFLCVPSIHEEVASALRELLHRKGDSDNGVNIRLLVDLDGQTFRQGYGDYKSVKQICSEKIEIKSLQDNRISFIIIDDIGYYLFVESRSMIPADKATINAVLIDPISQVRLKTYFFNFPNEKDFEDELTNAIIEESLKLKDANKLVDQYSAAVKVITEQELRQIGEDLYANPPLHPDYKRLVEFYSNKFQYVRLKFDGSNLQHRKIEIPTKVLPILDATLKERIETKLNLFESAELATIFAPLNEMKSEVDRIRNEYLTKVKSREERLLNKVAKKEFAQNIEALTSKIGEIQKSLLMGMDKLISQSREKLLSELKVFLKENPKAMFSAQQGNLWEKNAEYIASCAERKASEFVSEINWPYAHQLVKQFKLEVYYSDITYEDLKNPQFVTELKESGLIDSTDEPKIAIFETGIGIK
jgi:hypothetical protein